MTSESSKKLEKTMRNFFLGVRGATREGGDSHFEITPDVPSEL